MLASGVRRGSKQSQMSSQHSPSLFSDEGPPAPEPQQVSASDLRATHPLWERAAGRGPTVNNHSSGRGGGSINRPPSDAGADRPRFAPLSASALELLSFQADGAESSIAESADDLCTNKRSGKRPKKQQTQRGSREQQEEVVNGNDAEEEDDDAEEEEDHFGAGSDSDSDAGGDVKRHKKRHSDDENSAQKAAMLAAAAFGGAFHAEEASDVESSTGCSQTSSVRRKAAQRAAFPVRGVTCVGCALATKIAPVTRYVNEYAARMSETALWKQAGLCYVREVVEPCRLEGVVAPPWGWKDIRAHFTMHVVDERLGRLGTLRLLALMRQQAEQRLLRIETDGNKELDKHTTEQVLKIVKMESSERNLLEASLFAAATGGARAGSKGKGPKPSE